MGEIENQEETDEKPISGSMDNAAETSENEPRRTGRQPKPKKFEDYVTFMCSDVSAGSEVISDPVSVSEALSRPDQEKWKEAMKEEMEAFRENSAWELVENTQQGTLVDSKWIFKRKIDNDGKFCYRARLVARGFNQKEIMMILFLL